MGEEKERLLGGKREGRASWVAEIEYDHMHTQIKLEKIFLLERVWK